MGWVFFSSDASVLLTEELSVAMEGLDTLLQSGKLGIARGRQGGVAQPDLGTLFEDTWDVCPEGAVESDTEGLCGK